MRRMQRSKEEIGMGMVFVRIGIFFSMTMEYRVFAVVAVKGKQPDQLWPLIDYNTVLEGTSKAVYVLFI